MEDCLRTLNEANLSFTLAKKKKPHEKEPGGFKGK